MKDKKLQCLFDLNANIIVFYRTTGYEISKTKSAAKDNCWADISDYIAKN